MAVGKRVRKQAEHCPEKGRITLPPSLLGLESAEVELPTPYGKVICKMKAGEAPQILCPEEITLMK